MKKVLLWVIRIICILVIIAAACSVGYTLLHKDKTAEVTEEAPVVEAASDFGAAETVEEPSDVEDTAVAVVTEDIGGDENPSLVIYPGGNAEDEEGITITASFGDIDNSILADLRWYVDGELAQEDDERLIVDGSVLYFVYDPTGAESEDVIISLEAEFSGKTITAATSVSVEATGDVSGNAEQGSVSGNAEQASVSGNAGSEVKTMEIPVKIIESCSTYEDVDLDVPYGDLYLDAEAVLVAYDTNSYDQDVIQLRLEDDTLVWIVASHAEISDEDCTAESDYDDATKTAYVNDSEYESETDYLVWVSLYTQQVTVFKGEKGSWAVEEAFDCATGKNDTPTTTGTFTLEGVTDRWTLGAGDTYVAPVIVFNGGEAFTSLPKNAETDEVTDDTMGKPASGGGVRLSDDDIAWLADNVPEGTTVVVY